MRQCTHWLWLCVYTFVCLCAEVLTGAGGSLAALGGEAALGAATAAHTNPWPLRRDDCAGERGRWRRHPGGVRIHPNTTNTLTFNFNITSCAFHKRHAGAVVRSVVTVRVHTGQHRLNHDNPTEEKSINRESVFILVLHDVVMFQFISNVFTGVEVRALHRPTKLFHSNL